MRSGLAGRFAGEKRDRAMGDELSKYAGRIRNDLRTIEDHELANWQRQAVCRVCRAYAGQIDDGLRGSIFCGECAEKPLGCREQASAERLERFIGWAARRLMLDTRRKPREQRIRRLRSRDVEARQVDARRVG